MRRWVHCSPAFFAHSGASRMRPVWMSNAAPTPIMTLVVSWLRCSAMNRSCLGVLRPTQKRSGFNSSIVSASCPNSASVNGRNGWSVSPHNTNAWKLRQQPAFQLFCYTRRTAVEKVLIALLN